MFQRFDKRDAFCTLLTALRSWTKDNGSDPSRTKHLFVGCMSWVIRVIFV